ncbi:ANTAR domain-containing protein [Cellulosimicrobium sp. PMB13]|uniref:ANTAR domain-containing protein n=1 Tax=Cellulosimicrobium sp. PMB13 TaxID=3120158 RepID=UPI003F4BB6C0
MVLSRYLDEYAARAAGALGGDVEASITVREHGVTLRAGSSGDGAARCDQAEARADAGPCIDAMIGDAVLVVADVAREERWDDWREQSTREGFVKAVAVPSQVTPGVSVALNLYSRSPETWPDALIETADACARLIAAGVRLQLRFADVEDAAAGLYRTMSDGVAVERAVGAIMETNGCSPDEARDVLRSASEHRGVSRRAIAESILRSLAPGSGGDIVDERER